METWELPDELVTVKTNKFFSQQFKEEGGSPKVLAWCGAEWNQHECLSRHCVVLNGIKDGAATRCTGSATISSSRTSASRWLAVAARPHLLPPLWNSHGNCRIKVSLVQL